MSSAAVIGLRANSRGLQSVMLQEGICACHFYGSYLGLHGESRCGRSTPPTISQLKIENRAFRREVKNYRPGASSKRRLQDFEILCFPFLEFGLSPACLPVVIRKEKAENKRELGNYLGRSWRNPSHFIVHLQGRVHQGTENVGAV